MQKDMQVIQNINVTCLNVKYFPLFRNREVESAYGLIYVELICFSAH